MGIRSTGRIAASHDESEVSLTAIIHEGDGAAERKAIYNWTEFGRQRTADIVDIYSIVWLERIESWRKWIEANADRINLEAIISGSGNVREELDISIFFFLHPVAAYSLWHLLEACYALDEAIFRQPTGLPEFVSGWRQQKPFVYLDSADVKAKWKAQLEVLNTKIASEELGRDERWARLDDIVRCVKNLDITHVDLETTFSSNLKEEDREWMLAIIRRAMDGRFDMISNAIEPPGSAQTQPSVDGALGPSSELPPSQPKRQSAEAADTVMKKRRRRK